MANDDLVEMKGVIVGAFKGGTFKVKTDNNEVMCKPSGKIRLNKITLLIGDHVLVKVSPYDLSEGRIIRRLHGAKLDQ